MIDQAFLQCSGIGPARLSRLRDAGVRTWTDALMLQDALPRRWRETLVEESRRSLLALREKDVNYFVQRFHAKDKWRIVAHYCDEATYFDIETTGLEYDAAVTVISCWHRGRLHAFVEHENLDDFLELLDDVTLLVSFNGGAFDVPRVLNAFHIPGLPCPHVDLRWACYHLGWRGGLKDIARRAGVTRPPDLHDADGALAARLWSQWVNQGDRAARDLLVRYCAADVLMCLQLGRIWADRPLGHEELWRSLPDAAWRQPLPPAETAGLAPALSFGAAAPLKLRGWRERESSRFRGEGG